jgi:hypothetical protein
MGSTLRASVRLMLVNTLLEWWPSTILMMTHFLMFVRPLRLNKLERNALLLHHRYLVSFYVVASRCYRWKSVTFLSYRIKKLEIF